MSPEDKLKVLEQILNLRERHAGELIALHKKYQERQGKHLDDVSKLLDQIDALRTENQELKKHQK